MKIERALDWLIINNYLYRNIVKQQEHLDCLPDEELIPELIIENKFTDEEEDLILPSESAEIIEVESIHNISSHDIQNENGMLTSNNIGNIKEIDIMSLQRPIDLERTVQLLYLCYPELFPYGIGDVTDPSMIKAAKLEESISHYLHPATKRNSQICFPFSENKLFMFLTLELIENDAFKPRPIYFLNIIKILNICRRKNF